MTILGTVIAAIILSKEIYKLGDYKDTLILTEPKSEFKYNLTDSLPIHILSIFPSNEVNGWIKSKNNDFNEKLAELS
jgi:hypothetical protein